MSSEYIYEYVDENLKQDEKSLTVDFYFKSEVNKDEAIELIDSIIDNVDAKKMIGHKPTIFVKSPWSNA